MHHSQWEAGVWLLRATAGAAPLPVAAVGVYVCGCVHCMRVGGCPCTWVSMQVQACADVHTCSMYVLLHVCVLWSSRP